MGEEELSGKPGYQKLHQQDNILVHEEQINAIMSTIKPGLFNVFLKKFDKPMIVKYLKHIK